MTAPTYAYVEYEDGGKAIVSVSLIKDYQPNDVNDLACNKQVYWRQSGKGYEGEEGFYSGNVMVLGWDKADLIARMTKQHRPVPMDVFEETGQAYRHRQKPTLQDATTKEKRRRTEAAKKLSMGRIFRKKMGQGSDSGSDDEELVPRKHLKKAESKILALQNKLRISEQQRLEERQRNVKLQDLLEERLSKQCFICK
ncbi:uncharacterized protein LOC125942774 [Dermacentor silvarum]|uniref:uncharacterized protein LOC125942774 n=1 Tax=Dermacentor silvarum TaxID=543639 RepID=UPI0021016E95|nr:uncharacterized protein LOC125942774 [Dermacentor silvarum]